MFDHCLFFNATAMARSVERAWAQVFEKFDLTPPQAFMLRAVLAKPGQLQGELAATLAISRPTTTRALDALEKRRLIQRRPGKRDGREQGVFPTPAAETLRDGLNAEAAAMTRRLKHLMGEDVFADSVRAMRAVRDLVDRPGAKLKQES
ncbi:MAG TPA: MarR family transcriptional regulator [Rhodoblastus sp.]|nr:MarR family transcriptional regulator [Rhodoblastus sp.]